MKQIEAETFPKIEQYIAAAEVLVDTRTSELDPGVYYLFGKLPDMKLPVGVKADASIGHFFCLHSISSNQPIRRCFQHHQMVIIGIELIFISFCEMGAFQTFP